MGEDEGLVQGAVGMRNRVTWQVTGKEQARLILCLRGSRWTVGPNRSGEDAASSSLGGVQGRLSIGSCTIRVGPRGGARAWSHPHGSGQEGMGTGGGEAAWKKF